jgi:protein-tyrosine-phosphatase
MNVIFVCRQNIGRSQIAQSLFEKYSNSLSASYGTIVEIENQLIVDVLTLPYLIPKMKSKGCDLSKCRRNQLKNKHLECIDKIIVMAEKNNWPIFLKENSNVEYWDIKDPKDVSSREYDVIINIIDEKVKYFIKENNL